jgi:hypothetical protein
VCNDGVDNDGDGKTDYPEDRGCWWSGDGDEVNPECVDGIDNDGDGLTDHPADPGCFDTVFDDNEFNIACYDNFDNDGDGQVDYPDDPGCTSQDDQDETNPACNDDSDNDGDGLVDFPDDTGCYSLQDPDEVNPACIDGIDNDGDGLTDHPDDLGCISTEDNNETNPACIDGIDNDGDGATDYPNDASCTGTADNDELNPTACTDRKDNDGDSEIDFPNDPGCASQSDNDEFNQPQVYVRPKSARDITLSLVPSFNACTSPNRQHGPPLDSPSCSPPVQASATVTVGTTDSNGASTNSVGRVNLTVFPGDVRVAGSISDVRCRPEFTRTCGSANAAGGADYVGQLRGTHRLRITDRWNETSGVGGTEPGTVVDFPFPIVFSCAGTASDTIGATCTVDSSMNAIVPDAVRDGKRAIFDVGQLVINDAGTDGNIDTPPNRAFLTQGVFAP